MAFLRAWVGGALALTFLGCFAASAAVCEISKPRTMQTQAVCDLPGCPKGTDCYPPSVDTSDAELEFYDPIKVWKDKCPDPTIVGGCYEMYVDFLLKLHASDPSGIDAVGFTLVKTRGGVVTRNRYMTDASRVDGRWEVSGNFLVHCPALTKLQFAAESLCARDKAGNESCVPTSPKAEVRARSRRPN